MHITSSVHDSTLVQLALCARPPVASDAEDVVQPYVELLEKAIKYLSTNEREFEAIFLLRSLLLTLETHGVGSVTVGLLCSLSKLKRSVDPLISTLAQTILDVCNPV